MKTSTNALTARYCASQGWLCETVQQFYGGKRHDLFGFVDSVLLLDGAVYFLQNCSYGTLKAHRDEIDAHANRDVVARHGMIELWEWKKKRPNGSRRAQWYVRTQAYQRGVAWLFPSAWEGPFDLYPKKTK